MAEFCTATFANSDKYVYNKIFFNKHYFWTSTTLILLSIKIIFDPISVWKHLKQPSKLWSKCWCNLNQTVNGKLSGQIILNFLALALIDCVLQNPLYSDHSNTSISLLLRKIWSNQTWITRIFQHFLIRLNLELLCFPKIRLEFQLLNSQKAETKLWARIAYSNQTNA